MPNNNKWTREETIVAFNVYCKIPFKDSSKTHPEIIKCAQIIGRSPSALNMKVGNFGRLDPQLRERGISGLAHGSKVEQEVWDEFANDWERLIYESEILIAKFQNKTIENVADIDTANIPQGTERERTIRARVNQSFFRSVVLSSYRQRCCITGLALPTLLVASHIVPWRENEKERLNPRNGLCLNALHDKAFDRGFITVSPDYKVIVSARLRDVPTDDFAGAALIKFHNQQILTPDKFMPTKEFLEYHNRHVFQN